MSIHNKINVAVIGATGYTGLDLILMLSKHPKVNLINLCATKNLGKKICKWESKSKKGWKLKKQKRWSIKASGENNLQEKGRNMGKEKWEGNDKIENKRNWKQIS